MLNILHNKKGGAVAWIIIIFIIAITAIILMQMYTASQTHPFWEIR